jgi:hypothetical protein
MSTANLVHQRLYLTGYITALKDLRQLLGESDVPAMVALCGELDNKLAQLWQEMRALEGRRVKHVLRERRLIP